MNNANLPYLKTHRLIDIVDYISGSVATQSIIKKITGYMTVSSMDTGEELVQKISPFDHLIQVIEGQVEVITDNRSTQIEAGHLIIIPAHSNFKMKANIRCKILSTVIKSGYEETIL